MPDREGSCAELPFETAREREVYRYYQPPSKPAAPDSPPQSSFDTALSAFAQLATLRLGARRALISLIDRSSQHILAEATQTLSLQSELVHSEHDELWFGATTLPRDQGLCETALNILPPAQRGPQAWNLSPLTVNDLTSDDRFKDRLFVINRPTLRFFAAMPIRTNSGFNIGTLSVYDDQPRQGLDDAQKKFLDDLTVTIMAHLEMTRVKAAHRRSEKMVSGLGVFVEGRSSLRDWWLDTKNNKAWGPDDSRDADALKHTTGNTKFVDPLVAQVLPVQLDDQPPTRGRRNSLRPRTPQAREPTRSASDKTPRQFQPDPGGKEKSTEGHDVDAATEELPSKASEKAKDSPTSLQEEMLPAKLKDMFSRASNIIRECIEVDGTIFLDASVGSFGGGHVVESHRRIGEAIGNGESEESIVSIAAGQQTPELLEVFFDEDEPSPSREEEMRKQQQKKCGILGFATSTKSSLTGDHAPESYVPVSEAFLQTLLKKYPRGQIFDLTEGGELVPTIRRLSDSDGEMPEAPLIPSHGDRAKQKEVKAIVEMLPGVRSVAFSPLWDSHRERWFAGSFAWTTLSTRVLTRTEDVNYLAAFGNSIMADVARLDAVAADQAKSDFISSISHELRSPLHGILASVEFLQETTVDLFQNSMIDTIERCGRTLLDTIQHVLDFAKINNFVKPKRKESTSAGINPRTSSPSRQMGLSTDIDLSVVTEDVIDAMYAGYEFERNSSLAMASGFPSDGLPNGKMVDGSGMASTSEIKKERLEIIMDIGFRQNWFFHTQSGALRRVLMNLFCNSLKYTDVGWVKVSLQAEDVLSASTENPKSKVTITISDSGRGISEEFLHSNLFTPFVQENAMNPGTGLGLSIVLQIVRSLGGTIDVKSKLGEGTEVKVILTLSQTPVLPEVLLAANYENPALKTRRKTSGLTLGLFGFNETDPNAVVDVKSDHSRSLKSSLERVAALWFDVKVTPPGEWKTSPPDIYIANETPHVNGAADGTPIIVLCSNASIYRAYAENERHSTTGESGLVHFVSKPCGPCKLAKAFKFCLGSSSADSIVSILAAEDRKVVQFLEPSPALPTPIPTPLGLGALDSPQSLFSLSPDPEGSIGKVPYEYFPARPAFLHRSSTPLKTISSLNELAKVGVATKRSPVLLLVEDNEINMRLLETFIRKSKFEYDTATNGLLALQKFQNNPAKYDIVFMDISMPVMNGIDSTFQIRALEREHHLKPAMIVALTGLASAEAQQEAFSAGINLFLTKPVRFQALKELLGGWVPP